MQTKEAPVRRFDTETHCHCGAAYKGADHCPVCGCEQYEGKCDHDEIVEVMKQLDRAQLLRIARKATELADRQATHYVDYGGRDMRPKYLEGTPGRIGRRRGDRVEFRPLWWTQAYENGRVWRVSPKNLRPID